MLPSHRRHLYLIGNERQKSRTLGRLVFAVLAILITWYLASRVFALFDHAVGRRAPVVLSVRSGSESAQVSLQGDEWQRAESSLKLYPGDSVASRGNADIILSFFDGMKIRLDRGSEITIEQSDSYGPKGDSAIDLTLKSGRIWINSPSSLNFSGSIVRSVTLPTYIVSIPPDTSALAGSSELMVAKAAGLGLKTTLAFPKSGSQTIYIGEGQYLNLNEAAKRDIAGGLDPYDYRNPMPVPVKDEFFTDSYVLFAESSGPVMAAEPSGSDAPVMAENKNLILLYPENSAQVKAKTVTVSGQVSAKIATIMVNGQSIPIKKDLTFSVEISLGKDPAALIKVEALDVQGVVLQEVSRTVNNMYQPEVQPVRIKSPVGSGETLTTGLSEVEITGDAPPGAAGIKVNDYRLQLFKPGDKTWSYLASAALTNMVTGTNTYSVWAVDADGNLSPPRSIIVIYQPSVASGSGATPSQPPMKQNPPLTPGVIVVNSPAPGLAAVIALKEIVIEGQTSAETYSVSINGYTLSLYEPGKTTWNYIASTAMQTMKRGKNVYRIVARNKNGEILDVLEYTVTYKP